jgi:hypothetical protein
MQEERVLHEAKLAKMEAEMKMVFQQKVQEKEAKLKQSEEELYARHKEMKDALEKQRADLEDKKRKIESGRPLTPEKASVNISYIFAAILPLMTSIRLAERRASCVLRASKATALAVGHLSNPWSCFPFELFLYIPLVSLRCIHYAVSLPAHFLGPPSHSFARISPLLLSCLQYHSPDSLVLRGD